MIFNIENACNQLRRWKIFRGEKGLFKKMMKEMLEKILEAKLSPVASLPASSFTSYRPTFDRTIYLLQTGHLLLVLYTKKLTLSKSRSIFTINQE